MRRLAAMCFLCAACTGGCEPTLTNVEREVFQISCDSGSCHSAVTAQQSLDLSGDTFPELVNVPAVEKPGALRVVPGDPDRSFLMDKLLDRNLPTSTAATRTRMPPTAPLTEEQLDLVRAWIEAGARDD